MTLKIILLIQIFLSLIFIVNCFSVWMQIESPISIVWDKLTCKINKMYEPVLYGYNRIDHEVDDELHYIEVKGRSSHIKCFTWAIRYRTKKLHDNGKMGIVLCNQKKWYKNSVSIILQQNKAEMLRTTNRTVTSTVSTWSKRDIYSHNVFRTYWVSWKYGEYLFSEEGRYEPLMKWKDPHPFDVKYIGLSSDPEGGEYVIRDPKCAGTPYFDMVLMDCW